MGINIRQKGQEGEREISRALDDIVKEVLAQCGQHVSDKPVVQRNQNQSAVGGADLVGTYGLIIEIKRQEQLSINTWWKQCEKSAKECNGLPVLLYRQSRKPWKCVTVAELPLWSNGAFLGLQRVRVEISWEDFLTWFRQWVVNMVVNGIDDAKVEMESVRLLA